MQLIKKQYAVALLMVVAMMLSVQSASAGIIGDINTAIAADLPGILMELSAIAVIGLGIFILMFSIKLAIKAFSFIMRRG